MAIDLEKIRAAAERIARSYGLEVVDAELVGGGKHRVLRVSIEKDAAGRAKLAEAARAAAERGETDEDGAFPAAVLRGELSTEHLSGITHEDCERFSHDFGTLIDVEDLVPGAEYLLEVSSPGLDRRLSKAADYERFQGSLVKLDTFTPVAGNRHWQGRLMGVSDRKITLDRLAIPAKGKAKKAAAKTGQDALVEIELGNIEKAQLIPEL